MASEHKTFGDVLYLGLLLGTGLYILKTIKEIIIARPNKKKENND